ncbi:MAG: amidohydrolase family protein [Firmicutes bacterium]|nr:amidohydrolase family protein [Bacillota bacterium]
MTFGSDSCLEPGTADPFWGMFYACARGNDELCKKECLNPESEAIGRMDALLAYTLNCARQLGMETETGSIVPGKSADFVITDRDIIGCHLKELRDTHAVQVWFRGNRVFADKSS